jgi:hypothetical protein
MQVGKMPGGIGYEGAEPKTTPLIGLQRLSEAGGPGVGLVIRELALQADELADGVSTALEDG